MKKVQITLKLTLADAQAVLSFLADRQEADRLDVEEASLDDPYLVDHPEVAAFVAEVLQGDALDAEVKAAVEEAVCAEAGRTLDQQLAGRSMRDPFAAPPEFSNGLYRRSDGMSGYLYVYRSQAGSHYLAKKVVSDGDTASLGDYLGAATRFTTPGLRVESEIVKAFGQMFGWCGYCSRTLTDPVSQQIGCGKICADKNGVEHPGN